MSQNTSAVKRNAFDEKLISAWTRRPHLRVMDNAPDFEEKMRRLIVETSYFLEEPEPLEIERKFLIEWADIRRLENSHNWQRVEIIQTYLKSGEGGDVKVRQRGFSGHYIYFKAVKRKVTDVKRVEIEKRLSQA